ncbi:hypothetical protein U0355_13070 [Salimicrobium sp. PL1-032A]|uniref:hypothetical protein n=1 Tax=Salimicrobium sp. PL1-032A TaxID=3095364 RepID=UPI00326026E0
MHNLELTEDKKLRKMYAANIGALFDVKTPTFVPGLEMATLEQTAEYFEVEEYVIIGLLHCFREELEWNGYINMDKHYVIYDISKEKPEITSVKGKSIAKFKNGSLLHIPNRGLRSFDIYGLLYISMLLRNNKIAEAIRKQLTKERPLIKN